MSYVSAVEIYSQTETDAEKNVLIPSTSNLEGEYPGSALVDFSLALLLNTYRKFESADEMNTIYGTDGWVSVKEVYTHMKPGDVGGTEMLEYSILKCFEYEYIEVEYYDEVRYYKLKEKCLNLELYKFKNNNEAN